MAKNTKKQIHKYNVTHLLPTAIWQFPLILSLILLILVYFSFDLFLEDKFYPFTLIGDSNISFLTIGQATNLLSGKLTQKSNNQLQFHYLQKVYSINLATASASIDYSILELKIQKSHSPNFLERFDYQIKSLFSKNFIDAEVSIKIDSQLDLISTLVYKPSENAQLNFDETNSEGSPSANIQVKKSANGIELDKKRLEMEVKNYLLTNYYNNSLPVKIVQPKVTTEYVEGIKTILETSLKNPIKLHFEKEYVLDTKQLLAILDLESGQNLILDKEKTYEYLKKIAQEIDRQVQEGHFEFSAQTKRVTEFKPSLEGRTLDIDKTYTLIIEALNNPSDVNSKIITLPVAVLEPKIKTSDVNNLGIKELLGQGVSHFRGSIENRIYNINLAASRINGVLIGPEETFSFNDVVGDISQASGYKQAYVIKSGRTVLDDGGGVCQDSTTLFRAVLNAGLPIVQRVAHAYRVGYYEIGFPPGLDATVFAPSVDFKFKNDTPAHILIQAYTKGTTLYVDLYGTSDGRVATISKSTITNLTSPPPELRQDDPTLPKGEVKQVDFPAWGANVSFSRTVKRGGDTLIQETFRSNFKAWQAVYLVGTKEN